jgi:hypothetical protein
MADGFLNKGINTYNINNTPFISAVGTNNLVSNVNTISGSVKCNVGDVIIAFIMFRDSNPLVAPEGWEKIVESNVLHNDTDMFHKVACLTSIATIDGEISITVSQTNNNRMGIIMLSIKKCLKVQYNKNFDLYHIGTDGTIEYYKIPLKEKYEYILYVATTPWWTTSDSYRYRWEIKNDKLRIIQAAGEHYINSANQPRLCVIDNIIGNDEYFIRTNHNDTDFSFVLLGLELIPFD